MRFSSGSKLPTKADRARLLGLAVAILLVRGGERVGLTGTTLPPQRGNAQIARLSQALSQDAPQDYGAPEHRAMIPHARMLFISDFLGDMSEVRAALAKAADRGVRGVIFQVLDPAEESYPFHGRTIFESVGGTLRHETLKAGDLRDRYLARLAERRDELRRLCRASGWQIGQHHTSQSAQSALLWLYRALDGGNR